MLGEQSKKNTSQKGGKVQKGPKNKKVQNSKFGLFDKRAGVELDCAISERPS